MPCLANGAEDSSAGELAAALEEARRDPEPSFHLRVHRTDRDGMRSLELFPSGVAVWGGNTQIGLAGEIRSRMIASLVRYDFAHMETVYGGGKGPAKGALRITCRVELEIAGATRTSVQLADGELSAELAGLADSLLDLAEPEADHGISAADLGDGLRKLANGTLAAETLQLRFVRLPKAGEGEIVIVRDGEVSEKAYDPGTSIGEEVSRPVAGSDLEELVAALIAADVGSLPVNVWSEDHVELEVQVLGHRTAVVGRDFERLRSGGADPARERFGRLVAFLLEF